MLVDFDCPLDHVECSGHEVLVFGFEVKDVVGPEHGGEGSVPGDPHALSGALADLDGEGEHSVFVVDVIVHCSDGWIEVDFGDDLVFIELEFPVLIGDFFVEFVVRGLVREGSRSEHDHPSGGVVVLGDVEFMLGDEIGDGFGLGLGERFFAAVAGHPFLVRARGIVEPLGRVRGVGEIAVQVNAVFVFADEPGGADFGLPPRGLEISVRVE